MIHTCPPQDQKLRDVDYGHAIGNIEYGPVTQPDGSNPSFWYATNGEYGTEIFFCPFCGLNLASLNP